MPPLPVARFENDLPEIIRLLRRLVEQESPTTEKSAVDALGELIAGEMRALGAEVQQYPQTEAGDHWLGDWGEGTGGLLLLAHMDTVYSLGTLSPRSATCAPREGCPRHGYPCFAPRMRRPAVTPPGP